MNTWKKSLLTSLLVITSTASWQAIALPVTFSGASGTLASSATFDIVAGNLTVTLANTSAADTTVSADLLTGVFFNIAGNPLFTTISALSGGDTHTGSTINSNAGTNLGGEWSYLNGLSQYGANSGIASSGLGIFGSANFPGPNLSGPIAVNGFEFGIGSAGDNFSTGNPALLSKAITSGSVIFTLGGLAPGFSMADISAVTFQYGTALNEPSFAGTTPPTAASTTQIPEPGTLALLGLGLAGFGLFKRKNP